MKYNYHSHTPLCRHASGTPEEYVRLAIDGGLLGFGFSDHSPYPFPEGFRSPSRMNMELIDSYCSEIRTLKEKYKDHIEIYLGFETEYYPKYWDRLMQEYKRCGVEYMIFAGHFIGNEDNPDAFSAFERTADRERLTRFVDWNIAAMNTGRYTYFAHPDVLNFVGDNELYLCEMERLIIRAKELDLPLEINMYGMRDGRHYPRVDFWELVGRIGAPVVAGMDCHRLSHVANKDEMNAVARFADRYRLDLRDKLRLVSPVK